ncbi:hypothetical protein AVEN_166960-1 [Araneus ventricosus]|uniref:Uncharacterized protein n=1 Tax=Araneus ventricosus TaxID=182803 RepID=A0A4Y2K5G7_ARAVE|nr:hypothetical protein AVEN_166960-1 [Araneus ventricosus]
MGVGVGQAILNNISRRHEFHYEKKIIEIGRVVKAGGLGEGFLPHYFKYIDRYENRRSDPQKERLRVVQKASEIIRQDIRSALSEIDNYPPSTKLFSNVNTRLSESLVFLMEEIILEK